MSVSGGRVKVQVALKDLMAKWDLVRQYWNDDIARHFQEVTLDPLDGQIRSALTAMDKMRENLHRIKNEVGDRIF